VSYVDLFVKVTETEKELVDDKLGYGGGCVSEGSVERGEERERTFGSVDSSALDEVGEKVAAGNAVRRRRSSESCRSNGYPSGLDEGLQGWEKRREARNAQLKKDRNRVVADHDVLNLVDIRLCTEED
jgi:hypothetical protein